LDFVFKVGESCLLAFLCVLLQNEREGFLKTLFIFIHVDFQFPDSSIKKIFHIVKDCDGTILIETQFQFLKLLLAGFFIVNELQGFIQSFNLLFQLIHFTIVVLLMVVVVVLMLICLDCILFVLRYAKLLVFLKEGFHMIRFKHLSHSPDLVFSRANTSHILFPCVPEQLSPTVLVLLNDVFGKDEVDPHRLLRRFVHLALNPAELSLVRF
jgi:hypothetical protein